jgi:hypothetical protein
MEELKSDGFKLRKGKHHIPRELEKRQNISHMEYKRNLDKRLRARLANELHLEYETTAYLKDTIERLLTKKTRLELDRRTGDVDDIVSDIDKAFIKRVESVRFMESYHLHTRLVRRRVEDNHHTLDGLREDLRMYDKLKRYEKIHNERLETEALARKRSEERKRKK